MRPPDWMRQVEASHSQQTTATPLEASLPVEAWETPLTLPGNVVGTPKYMAPELLKGQPADARSDLFAFCVSLYEALAGQPPFTGATLAERMRAQLEGHLNPPPARTEVPAWVWSVVAQGLSARPEQRPASLHAFLTLLEEDREARRRERLRRAALVCGAAVLVVLGAWGWVRGQGPGCRALMERRLAGVWDAPMRAQVRGALVATGLSYAADTAQRVEAGMDGYARAWVKMSQQVCEAAGTRAEQARGLSVLREACLERRRSQLRALTELLAKAPDKELVPKAVQAVQSLPPLDYCADEQALTAAVPPPEEPALRARVEELQQRVDRLEALNDAGKYKQGLVLVCAEDEPQRRVLAGLTLVAVEPAQVEFQLPLVAGIEAAELEVDGDQGAQRSVEEEQVEVVVVGANRHALLAAMKLNPEPCSSRKDSSSRRIAASNSASLKLEGSPRKSRT